MVYNKVTTPEEDKALAQIAIVRSERLPVPLTAQDLLQAVTDGAVRDIVAEANSRTNTSRTFKLQNATQQDQDAVDAILAKY